MTVTQIPSSPASPSHPWRRPSFWGRLVSSLGPGLRYRLFGAIPTKLHVMVSEHAVLFPGTFMPVSLNSNETRYIFETSWTWGLPFAVIFAGAKDATKPVACVATHRKRAGNAGSTEAIVQGVARVRLVRWLHQGAVGEFEAVNDDAPNGAAAVAELTATRQAAMMVMDHLPEIPKFARDLVLGIHEPGHLADVILSNLDITLEEKQAALEELNVSNRCAIAQRRMQEQLAVLILESHSRPTSDGST